jgi:hypothetical protein
MRDDTRVGHADSECVLTLFHVARVYARSGNANPDLTRKRLWLVHLADGQNVARPALLFIPSRSQNCGPLLIFSCGEAFHLATITHTENSD